ncbi:diiron oxygenase [Nocardia puris]|uniref:Para-aminobenzoate N-oxygenase AurF n=1 Tax=Nocardia puris TaxID=208602 RepID=A0A366DVV3_9NOCA|nr:diiron oxygenase [Nocardia puris]RBO94212.1 para-aminobenzoate N-oxygenase AurF [Nocardia puris]
MGTTKSYGDHEFRPATTASGGPVRHRRGIADGATATRLLFAASEQAYDPDLDIDWDAPVVPDAEWLPAQWISLHGTWLWRWLGEEQRAELAKRELVALLTAGIHAQSVVGMLDFRDLIEGDSPVDDRSRFLLSAINDEARRTTMFSRLVAKSGVAPYPLSPPLRVLAKFVLLTPTGPAGLAFRLLLEEMVAAVLRDVAGHPGAPPHLRQVSILTAPGAARHVELTREELVAAVRARGPAANALHRWLAAAITASLYAAAIEPRAYRDAGVSPGIAVVAALTGPAYRRNARRATASFREFATAQGILRGPVAATILRLGGLR